MVVLYKCGSKGHPIKRRLQVQLSVPGTLLLLKPASPLNIHPNPFTKAMVKLTKAEGWHS